MWSINSTYRSGAGGNGGNGGGGAGAGIGGRGGNGGGGGSGGSVAKVSSKGSSAAGNSGTKGGGGTNGGACGAVEVSGSVTVIPRGGAGGAAGKGGAGGEWGVDDGPNWYVGFGGGGGGGGGAGLAASDIGGGGGGAGGGSGCYEWFGAGRSEAATKHTGFGGGGAGGAPNGANGANMNGTRARIKAGYDEYERGSQHDTHVDNDGAPGGAAGAAGSRGGEGTLTIGANAQVLAERGYYSVGRIPETGEDVVYDNGKLFRVSNGVSTEIAYTVVTKDTGWLDVGKWYVVKGIVNRSDTLSVHEGQAANLVLLHGAALTIDCAWKSDPDGFDSWAGIAVKSGCALNIFGVESGALTAIGSSLAAGIGGSYHLPFLWPVIDNCGTVTINGGTVTARGGGESAGIGGGNGGAGGTVTINGGRVEAVGNNAAAIGAGCRNDSAGTLEVGPRVFKLDDNHWQEGVFVTFDIPSGLKLVSAKTDGGPLNLTGSGSSRTAFFLPGKCLTLTFGLADFSSLIEGDAQVVVGSVFKDGVLDVGRLLKAKARDQRVVEYVLPEGTPAQGNAYPLYSTDESLSMGNGAWYVVEGEVTTAVIEVRGEANLILADGAKLTVNGGIRVEGNNKLNIYAQSAGTGELIANGAGHCAGIGGGNGGAGGTVTINGGRVTALGRDGGKGIGGGEKANGGSVKITGGTVKADGWHGQGLGGAITIDGGSVKTKAFESQPKNGAGKNVHCVTVEVEKLNVEKLNVEGLDGYGTKDIFALDGKVYLYLPDGAYSLTINGVLYRFVVEGKDLTAVPNKYLLKVPYVVNATATVRVNNQVVTGAGFAGGYVQIAVDGAEVVVSYATVVPSGMTGETSFTASNVTGDLCLPPENEAPHVNPIDYVDADGVAHTVSDYLLVGDETKTLMNGWYVAIGQFVSSGIEVAEGCTANLILADGAKLTVNGGIRVEGDNKLNIYGQHAGTGELIANGAYRCAGIGSGRGVRDSGVRCGTVTVNGGRVTAQGGAAGAGIGGGYAGAGGTVTITGGRVTALGRDGGKGIGGGEYAGGGSVKITGGTVEADGWNGQGRGGAVTIDGGSVKTQACESQPKNGAGKEVCCVTVEGLGGLEGLVRLEGLVGYGTKDIVPIDGRVYLYLPDGTHRFTVLDGSTRLGYCAVVKGRKVTVESLPPKTKIGFFVNDEDVGFDGSGDGWSYDDKSKELSFNGTGPYVLSGMATNNEVQIKATEGARIILSNAVVFTEGRSVLEVAKSASLLMAGDTSCFAATNNAAAVTVAAGATLTVDLLSAKDRLESMICAFAFDAANAIGGGGTVRVNGGTFFAWSDAPAFAKGTGISCGAGVVMKTGDDPETATFADDAGNAPCVLVAPVVTVTVRNDIPHVTGFMVSNAVEEVKGKSVGDITEYRVMLEDDVFVGYTVDAGYVSQVGNPLAYFAVEDENITIDASTIPTALIIPYRAWNEGMQQMEDLECTDYTFVTADTATFEDDKWYVVTEDVACGMIAVDGVAHLILADGAALTAESLTGGTLTVYGQAEGIGSLKVSGAVEAQVKNAKGQEVYGVAVECGVQSAECGVVVSGLEAYGSTGARVVDGKVYVWLPNGEYKFSLWNGNEKVGDYRAVVNGAAVTAEQLEPVGFSVDGNDVGLAGSGEGWSYFGKVLTITGREKEYVLSGTAENDEVQIRVASSSSVVLSNAVVFTSGRPAVEVVGGNSWRTDVALRMTGGTSVLAATNGVSAVTVESTVYLLVDLASSGTRGTSAIEIRNFGDTAPAVYNRGNVFVAGGTLRVRSESWAFWQIFSYHTDLTGKAGDNAETARYMDDEFLYTEPYFVVAPVCRVKVPRTLPEGVESCVVSNRNEQLPASENYDHDPDYQVFRTMLGDDITVDFTADWGYEITSGGHVAYPNIQTEQTVALPQVRKVQAPEWPDPQAASKQTAAEVYGIPPDAKLAEADAGTIAAWATAKGVAADSFVTAPDTYEEAFLLNCAPEEAATEEAAYRILSFGQNADDEWKVTVQTVNTKKEPYNGISVFEFFSDAACTTPVEENDPSALFIRASLRVLPAGE